VTLAFYTLDEVAERFRVSRRTMQGFVKEHPYYRVIGRRKLFTEEDILALAEKLECPSSSSDATALHSGTSAAPSEASLWTRAQRLLTKQPPKRSGRKGSGNSHKDRCSVVVPLRHSSRPP
jgi:excisionase family DNA binding protein